MDVSKANGQATVTLSDLHQYRKLLQYLMADETTQEECWGENTQLFVQVACTIPSDQIDTRKLQGLFIGCLFTGVALFVIVYLDYIRQVAKNNFVEWDVKTITAGDYTIEFDISKDFFEKFKSVHGDKKPADKTMAQFFNAWITKEMEDKLSTMPDLGYEETP